MKRKSKTIRQNTRNEKSKLTKAEEEEDDDIREKIVQKKALIDVKLIESIIYETILCMRDMHFIECE